jgi:diadenosine tetraphosphatase ApaH/serine/threonine PP2A family protein phosphatase
MKLALMSDLHANRQATEAVWSHLQHLGFDRLLLLGDYVDYGADPAWVVDWVQARQQEGAVVLRGNHDEAASSEDNHGLSDHVLPSLNWTRQALSADQRRWLATLPLSGQVGPCLAVHANAQDPGHWAYIQGRMEAVNSLQATASQYVVCGHMHEQALYHLTMTGKTGAFQPTPGVPIALSAARRWLAVAGSVGQPRDGNPAAACALLDVAQGQITFLRVPYDHEEAAQRIEQAGLPAFFAKRLRDGQ